MLDLNLSITTNMAMGLTLLKFSISSLLTAFSMGSGEAKNFIASQASFIPTWTVPTALRSSLLLVSNGNSTATISLLSDGQLMAILASTKNIDMCTIAYLDTLALRQTDPRLFLSDDENVALPSSEVIVNSIFNVDNVEPSIVTFTVSDDTNTTHVATTSYHCDDAGIEADEVSDFSSCEVDLDCVVDLDGRVWVTNSIRSISICGISNQTLVQRLIDAEPQLTCEHHA